jgi:transcriptional regulator with XRE-family HTH domain
MLNMEDFGRRLAELRRQSGLKQREIAEHIGVSVQAVSKWERGLSCPDILVLDELSSVLGVTISELFH